MLTKFSFEVNVCCEVPESQMCVFESFSSILWILGLDIGVVVRLALANRVLTSKSAGIPDKSASQSFSSSSSTFATRAATGGSSF